MRSSYSGEFKSHERASRCQFISVNRTTIIFMTTHGARMREQFLFHILSCSHMSSSNEICANKGADTAALLIMNVITQRIAIHSKQ